LALRPEKLQLWLAPPPKFAIPATVSSVGYFGGVSIVHLSAGQARLLKVRLPSGAASYFAQGMAVWASWSTDDGIVIMQ
jgi:hypothetical protein